MHLNKNHRHKNHEKVFALPYCYMPFLSDIRPRADQDQHHFECSVSWNKTNWCPASSPCVMLSKEPELTPAQIDEILENTAVPLTSHKRNDFGSGRIDALAAVNAVPTWNDVIEVDGHQDHIFPNPSKDVFTIECEGMHLIEVFGMDGRLVKHIQTASPVHQLKGLTSGTYLVKITTDDAVIVKKVVKL